MSAVRGESSVSCDFAFQPHHLCDPIVTVLLNNEVVLTKSALDTKAFYTRKAYTSEKIRNEATIEFKLVDDDDVGEDFLFSYKKTFSLKEELYRYTEKVCDQFGNCIRYTVFWESELINMQ